MFLWWRLLYGLVETQFAIWSAAAMLNVVERMGPRAGSALLDRAEGVIFSGWPHHPRGWVNLHVSRFVARVRHARFADPPVAQRRVAEASDGRPFKVGCIGPFNGLLGFPKEVFD